MQEEGEGLEGGFPLVASLLQSIGGKRMEGGPLLRMRRLWWRLGTAGWELEEDADTGPVEDC